jgi:EmrB/QacA subfamily drug resistance transporter
VEAGAATRTSSEVRRQGPRWLVVEPARPGWLRRHGAAHYFALATVCIGAFMGQLDASIVTVAFPSLQRSFHASVGSVTWVGLAYLVVLVVAVTAVGKVSDMIGHKLLYTYGFVVFIVGSGLCGLAPNLLCLDVFRVLQGFGAAMLQANSVAIIYLAMPRNRLGRGIGIQGASQALGLALGPAVGGLLLAAWSWRLIFLVNVPAGVVGTAAAWVFLPRSRDLRPRTRFDWRGMVLLTPALSAVLVALTFGNEWGWTSPGILGLLVVSIATALWFIGHERRWPDPLVSLALFRVGDFAMGIASGLLAYAVLFGTMFIVPFYLEEATGARSAQVGFTLATLPVALGCAAPIAGRLSERVGTRPLAVAGMALTCIGLGSAGLSRPAGWSLVAHLAIIGIGLGLFISPNNAGVMRCAPRAEAGMAGGILNMTRGLGTTLGLALTGLVAGAVAAGRLSAAAAPQGFEAACVFLASLSMLAALLATRLRPTVSTSADTNSAPSSD